MINIDQIINNITDIFKDEGIEKVILFGSYAYGIPTINSDIDLLSLS